MFRSALTRKKHTVHAWRRDSSGGLRDSESGSLRSALPPAALSLPPSPPLSSRRSHSRARRRAAGDGRRRGVLQRCGRQARMRGQKQSHTLLTLNRCITPQSARCAAKHTQRCFPTHNHHIHDTLHPLSCLLIVARGCENLVTLAEWMADCALVTDSTFAAPASQRSVNQLASCLLC